MAQASDKKAAQNGTDVALDALRVEAGRIEERLTTARNQYNSWVQKSEEAKGNFEKLQKDIADWQRKVYADMEVKESDLKSRELSVIKHETEIKDKIIDAQRTKMKAEDAESRYKEALERTETFFAKLKNLRDLLTEEFKKIN